MSGILDKKNRIMDVILTREGRRQISTGKMKVEYASFTDRHAYYQEDITSGSEDATNRIYHEATGLVQDSIFFESDDSGQLVRYDGGPYIHINRSLYSSTVTGSFRSGSYQLITGSAEFASIAESMITSSLQNFKDQQLIGSRGFLDSENFTLSTSSLEYVMTRTNPFTIGYDEKAEKVNNLEPLFLDRRLAHIDNFQFLPPVCESSKGSGLGIPLGRYVDYKSYDAMSYEDLARELKGYNSSRRALQFLGYGKSIASVTEPRQKEDVSFISTSDENNICMQMFEIDASAGEMSKMDVIDFGEFSFNTEEGTVNSLGQVVTHGTVTKRVFFIGRIFLDSLNTPSFVNIFTMVLE